MEDKKVLNNEEPEKVNGGGVGGLCYRCKKNNAVVFISTV